MLILQILVCVGPAVGWACGRLSVLPLGSVLSPQLCVSHRAEILSVSLARQWTPLGQVSCLMRLPWWLRWWRICLRCRRPGFDSWVKKTPGEGNGNPLQYSSLKNPMDGGTWWATVHGVAKNWTQLSEFHSFISLIYHSTFPVIGIVK